MAIRRWPGAAAFDDLGNRVGRTIRQNWYLGFTSFGGPPVHFKIFHDKFVNKLGWISEQVYQELFSVCQAFSGPGSTKMHYCITLLHDGFLPAVLGFLIWSLPGAIGMFALGLGVSNIDDTLPRAVYALLSGLNAATVGTVALAAVQLSDKAATDTLTRILVFLGAAAGLMYNALWYFPLLMFLAGITAVVHDYRWLHGPVKAVIGVFEKARRNKERDQVVEDGQQNTAQESHDDAVELHNQQNASNNTGTVRRATSTRSTSTAAAADDANNSPSTTEAEPRVVPPSHQLSMSWKSGLALILLFLASFAAIMALRGALPRPVPRLFALFANMYLAGTIIFGGGPVVIPLLREYIVAEGWVSPRDFLIGLAIIQAFPGPNFNFAVYLGALTASNAGLHPAAGAVVGWIGIFAPGLITVHGTMGIWSAIRGWRWVRSGLRGINAAAVGLIYTAVYRLWEIGFLDEGFERGSSLARDPWWVVVTATSFMGGHWFGVSPPVAIILGGVMGMIWYGVVTA